MPFLRLKFAFPLFWLLLVPAAVSFLYLGCTQKAAPESESTVASPPPMIIGLVPEQSLFTMKKHDDSAGDIFPKALLKRPGIQDYKTFFSRSVIVGGRDVAAMTVRAQKTDPGAMN